VCFAKILQTQCLPYLCLIDGEKIFETEYKTFMLEYLSGDGLLDLGTGGFTRETGGLFWGRLTDQAGISTSWIRDPAVFFLKSDILYMEQN
jgi:hypothetical protein